MCVAADSAGRLRYMGTWIGERTGRHEEEESGGGLCHDCGRDIPDWLSNQEYLRPCEHGYRRCVGRGHHCQGAVVCSSVADQYRAEHSVICGRILFLRLAVYQAHPLCHGHALGFPVCSAGSVLSGKRPLSVSLIRGNHKRRGNRPGVSDQLHHRRYGSAGGSDPEATQALYPGPDHAGAGRPDCGGGRLRVRHQDRSLRPHCYLLCG